MGSGIKGLKRAGSRDQGSVDGSPPWELESQRVGSGSALLFMESGINFCGFRDQNSHRFWVQGSKFGVKIWDQLRKNISRYDPEICTLISETH